MLVISSRILHSTLCSESTSRCAVLLCQRSFSTLNVKEKVIEEERVTNSRRKEIPSKDAVREKEIDIKTCGQLFEKWRQERRYWKIAKSEIALRVKYIDTGDHGDAANIPTVMSLHGSPGSYKDFEPLTAHLHQQGVRVIAPNFPGIELPPTTFRSTPEEKSEFVNDFLRTIEVPRVDMLVCHSSALFPGLLLSLGNHRFSPKSLVLLNPTALDIPRLLHPPWLLHFMVRMYEFPIGQHLTNFIGRKIAAKPELKKGTFEEHFQSAITLMNSYIPKQVVPFQSLLNQNYPIMMAFSKNDKLIAKKSSYKMANMMLKLEEIDAYDKEGKKVNSGGLNPFRKAMSFENGTHFLLKTYPGIVCEEVSSFLGHHLKNRVNMK